jgi:6-pyruvoyltetrahydropterin/6-carboxytetrahydropterin synthase
MYTLCAQRAFNARHWLVGGDWGSENQVHTHSYRIELRLSAERLDRHGYLADLCELEPLLDECVAVYKDRLLNELDEFEGLNPSIERFARLFHLRFMQRLGDHPFSAVEIRVWENETAWAGFREDF